MQYRRLGRHGLEVPPLCLGTMTFGYQVDEAASLTILDAAYERGLTFLDTADAYPLGGSLETVGTTEAILGRWMTSRGNRDRIILASKCFAPMRRGPNARGLSRAHVIEAVEASLTRLQTDHIDLYQAHGFDAHTPIDETLKAFDDLIRAGKVRYIGCSNYPAWRLGQALATADRLGLTRYQSLQPRYNLLYREIETELLPLARAEGLGVITYNPLAGGLLSGKYDRNAGLQEHTRFTLGSAAERYQTRYWHAPYFDAVDALARAVAERDVSMVAVAVAWVLRQAGITSAIIGVSRAEQLDANLAALEVDFDDALSQACDALWWQLPRRPVAEGYR